MVFGEIPEGKLADFEKELEEHGWQRTGYPHQWRQDESGKVVIALIRIESMAQFRRRYFKTGRERGGGGAAGA